jgi:hypothetical protein
MKKIFLAVILILSPLFYSNALACSCPTIGTTSEQAKAARLKDFKSAAAFFTGEVIELEENKVKFKIDKIWKGESVDEILMVIQLKKDDGRYVRTSCDYYYELNEKYLVYAYGTSEELTTYECTRTTRFKNTELIEQEIKGLDEIKLPEVRKKKSK